MPVGCYQESSLLSHAKVIIFFKLAYFKWVRLTDSKNLSKRSFVTFSGKECTTTVAVPSEKQS